MDHETSNPYETAIPSLRYSPGNSIITPGDRLGSTRHILPGPGTFAKGMHIYASLTGILKLSPVENDESNQNASVSPSHIASIQIREEKSCPSNSILNVGQIVLARVVRVGLQQVFIEIIASHGNQNGPDNMTTYGGMIRKEDIRSGATEEIKITDQYLPGDVIFARIISMGDARRYYYCSTNENHLGVIRATCSICKSNRFLSAGKSRMRPINWKEMECPITKKRELRKVARPTNHFQ